MDSFIKTLTGAAAIAALGAVLTVGTAQHARAQSPAAQPAQPAAQPEKKPKDTGEYDIANEVFKDIQAATPNWQKAIADLNTWTQKYPDSDYKDDRLLYYQQAYYSMTPPQYYDKAVDYGAQLMAKDLKTIFKDPSQYLTILTRTALAAAGIPNATPSQLATGDNAATTLLDALAAGVKPAGQTDAQWAPGKKQLQDLANATLQTIAMSPGNQAVRDKDYAKAEQEYTKALQKRPDDGLIAYSLGSAIMNEKDPSKYSRALYAVARGAATDPAKGGIADPAVRTQVDAYLKRVYTTVHGSDEGLDQLKQQALASPLPPPDFKIKIGAEIALEKQKAFEAKYPEFALWMGIKGMLTGPDADKNFADMKDTEVKGLKGVVTKGNPDCRSKEVLVSIPDPEQQSAPPDTLTLKLDKPLTGKPVAGTEIKWDGVPAAFTKEPFMLTMSVDQADIQGMKTETCVPAKTGPAKKPAPGGAVKKPAPKN